MRGASDAQQGSARYAFRPDIWRRLQRAKHWPSVNAAARELGVSDTTLARALSGETLPGNRLMASLMAALPDEWTHEQVFVLLVDRAHADGAGQVA
ncbi:hypothetical protein SMC26_40440 [Actinomadura fulvescens]|uniref:Uncharacterized protein n=1 Tax=Actinomadura fulvescens TaxID=46160 RepID=A0ABP6CJF9_9ACTN